MKKVQLWLLQSVFFIAQLFPARWMGALGAGVGRMLFYVLRRIRLITLANLTRVYPEKSRTWRIRMARASFAEAGRTAFELPHVFLRGKDFLLSRIEIEGEDELKQALSEEKGVFIVAAHHSNWELEALTFSMLGYDSTTIYHPMKNKVLDDYMMQRRTRFGAQMQSRQAGLRWLPRALKNGQLIGVMIDQHMSNGIQVPFLGHLANTTALPASYIQRRPTPVIAISLDRIGHDFRFKLRLQKVMMPALSEDKAANTYHMMQTIGDTFAPIIHARPELWLWLHRRWYILEQEEKIAKVVYGTP
ncbi:MAG: lysophospholipid acyltransferase family protein [Mariprofundaceae bacterium]|nr:lysophospholipid acyltransferase family protein [Mariprofundaceae bacterium]